MFILTLIFFISKIVIFQSFVLVRCASQKILPLYFLFRTVLGAMTLVAKYWTAPLIAFFCQKYFDFFLFLLMFWFKTQYQKYSLILIEIIEYTYYIQYNNRDNVNIIKSGVRFNPSKLNRKEELRGSKPLLDDLLKNLYTQYYSPRKYQNLHQKWSNRIKRTDMVLEFSSDNKSIMVLCLRNFLSI